MSRERTRTPHRASARLPVDAGISMSELIVGMFVLTIVTAMIASFYVSTMRTVTVSSALTTNTQMASNGMNELARVIRAGTTNPRASAELPTPAFVKATSRSIVMHAFVNLRSSEQTPVLVEFSVDAAGRLIERTWNATSHADGYWTFPTMEKLAESPPTATAPSSTRVLASSVAPTATGGAQLFRYVAADGSEISLPSAGLGEDARRSVAAVTVTLVIQGATDDSRSRVTLQNTVGIPNLGLTRSVP
jgi:hypothetical protein